MLTLTPSLKQLIRAGGNEAALRAAADAGGMQWLRDDAAAKIRSGLTTVEEVLRVVRVAGSNGAVPERATNRLLSHATRSA